MSKDPGFIFYPGDYLKDTQTLIVVAWLIIVILVIKCYESHGQMAPRRVFPEPGERIKQVLIISAWTTLDAMSDAYIAQDKNQVIAHTMDAAGTGLLITLPFTTKLTWDDGPRFLSSAIMIHMGAFDMIYNKTHGYPACGYRTDVSLWDKAIGWVDPPPSAEVIGRGFFITFGVVISLTGEKH